MITPAVEPPQTDLPTEILTKRLILRAYRPGDGAQYFDMLQQNREHLNEFLPPNLQGAQSAAEIEAFIRWQDEAWQQRDLFIFGAWEKASGSYVGEVYLANPDWHVPSIELGYFVAQAHIRKGYASEVAEAALRLAFEHLQVSRVDLQCRADNIASQRVAERCGFIMEGCQRLRHRKKSGELVDRLWYGLLRTEWQAGNGKREVLPTASG